MVAGLAEDDHQLRFVVEDVGVDVRQHHGRPAADERVGRLEEAPHRRGLAVAVLAVVAAHGQHLGARQRRFQRDRLERHGIARRGELDEARLQLAKRSMMARMPS